jgi:cyclase
VRGTRRDFLATGIQVVGAATLGVLTRPGLAGTDLHVATTELVPGMTLLAGAGCNVVAVRGPEGSLLVDGGYAKNSKALLAAAAQATGNARVNTLINTHWHPAQTGSNEAIGRAGGQIIAHERTREYLSRAVASVDYAGLYGPLSPAGRPTKTTRTGGSLTFAGQPVEYGYLPAAHTDGDLYIHFPQVNLLAAGGPVCGDGWPLLDYRNGAWLGGLVRAHEKLAALVRPDTRIVPANGRLLTGAELVRHHDMYAAFHERMVAYMNRGWDSRDAIADRPLKEFEAQFGDPSEFIYGAFQSLNLAYSPD